LDSLAQLGWERSSTPFASEASPSRFVNPFEDESQAFKQDFEYDLGQYLEYSWKHTGPNPF
jgi:hypothetical protein